MNNQITSTEKQLNKIYRTASNKINEIVNRIETGNYSDDEVSELLEEVRKYKNEIVEEVAKAGEQSRSLITNGAIKLFKYSFFSSLLGINKRVGFEVNWDLPTASELQSLANKERNIYDLRAGDNLSYMPDIRRHFDNALISAKLRGISKKNIPKHLEQNTAGRYWNNATRLMRTQLMGSLNGGRFRAFEKADKMDIKGVKKWVSTYDGRTRKTHKLLQGFKASLFEQFPNGLMYPRDPDGDPSEVVNCRCTISYIVDGGQEFDYAKSAGVPPYDITEIMEEFK